MKLMGKIHFMKMSLSKIRRKLRIHTYNAAEVKSHLGNARICQVPSSHSR